MLALRVRVRRHGTVYSYCSMRCVHCWSLKESSTRYGLVRVRVRVRGRVRVSGRVTVRG